MKHFGKRLFGLAAIMTFGLAGCAASDGSENGAEAHGAAATHFDTDACGWGGDLPPGSYQQSCSDCVLADGALECVCAGSAPESRLVFESCPGDYDDVANCDGKLKLGSCDDLKGGGACHMPNGGWGSCTYYEADEVKQGKLDCADSGGVWSSTTPCDPTWGT